MPRGENAKQGLQGFQRATAGKNAPSAGPANQPVYESDGHDSHNEDRVSWIQGLQNRYVQYRATSTMQKIGRMFGFTVISRDESTGEWLHHSQGGVHVRRVTEIESQMLHTAEQLDSVARNRDVARDPDVRDRVSQAQELLKSAAKPYSVARFTSVSDAERERSAADLRVAIEIVRELQQERG